MKSLASYLLTMFAVMFWIFRMIVALAATMKMDIGIAPVNLTYEIILLFVTLFAIILIIKRNIIGAFIYFASYLLYFGTGVLNTVSGLIEGTVEMTQYFDLFISVLAIILATGTLFDVLLNKNRTNNNAHNKKTDWYYKDATYDRQLDERADKNNYRTL